MSDAMPVRVGCYFVEVSYDELKGIRFMPIHGGRIRINLRTIDLQTHNLSANASRTSESEFFEEFNCPRFPEGINVLSEFFGREYFPLSKHSKCDAGQESHCFNNATYKTKLVHDLSFQ